MNKTRLLLQLLIFANYFSFSQSTSEIEITLSTNSFFNTENFIDPVKITNTETVLVSGEFTSQNYIRVVAIPNKSIIFKPTSTSPAAPRLSSNPLPDVSTGIKVKPPGGGGGGLPPPPTLNIYPNPVQTDLNFSISNNTVTGYSIYNLNGILQLSQTITPTSTGTINVANLTNNTYILRLNISTGQQVSIHFIKN